MPKPHGEVLVTGACHPPGRKLAAQSSVAVKVGPVDKTLAVFGDRFWTYADDMVAGATPPRPFTRMPVVYENAFGGDGFDLNPVGKGIATVALESGETVHPLPNIEDPAHLIRAAEDRPDPAGFGPLDLMWPQRFGKQGTYDKKWKKERFPYYPDDTDWEFFNCAPEDQYLKGFFEGGEPIEITNMHPDIPVIRSEIPRLRVRCFVTRIERPGPDGEMFREMPTTIDTVRVFLTTEKLSEAQRKAADLNVPVDMAPLSAAGKKIGKVLKRVKALPKKIEAVKKQAMGKAPVMPPPTPGEMQALGDRIIRGNLANIPSKKFDEIRAAMGKVEKGIATARSKVEQAQNDAAKIKQQMGDQLKQKVPAEHLEKAGIDPDNLLPLPSVNPWHDTGFPFVAASRRRLAADVATQERLAALGFERRTIRRHWLGVNPEPLDTAARD